MKSEKKESGWDWGDIAEAIGDLLLAILFFWGDD